MKRTIIAAALLLGACATDDRLASAPPKQVYHSAKARGAVADCLLARMGGIGVKPEIEATTGETTLKFTSLQQWTNPGLYLFTIRDEGAGSAIEARSPRGFVKLGFPAAETCF